MLAGVGAFALGLLPYAYLPLRSRQNPALDWGDPETLERFLAVLTRRDFWERRYLEGAADLLSIAGDWLASLLTELAWVGLPLAVLAVLASWRAPRAPGTRSVPPPVPVPLPASVPQPVPDSSVFTNSDPPAVSMSSPAVARTIPFTVSVGISQNPVT